MAARRGYSGPLPKVKVQKPSRAEFVRLVREKKLRARKPAAVRAGRDRLLRILRISTATRVGGGSPTEKAPGVYYWKDSEILLAPGASHGTLVHELFHALQIAIHGGPFDDTTLDSTLASLGLIEGDASLATAIHLNGEKRARREVLLADQRWQGPKGLSKYDSILFRYPYIDGLRFATFVFDRSGWQGLNRALSKQPTTTEQILHPSKYFAGEGPEPVARTILDPDDTVVHADRLGELAISALLQHHGAAEVDASRAAEGWAGDAIGVYRRSAGAGRYYIVHDTQWDTEADAREFASATMSMLVAAFCKSHVERLDDILECTDSASALTGVWRWKNRATVFYCVPRSKSDALRRSLRSSLGFGSARE